MALYSTSIRPASAKLYQCHREASAIDVSHALERGPLLSGTSVGKVYGGLKI